MSNHSMTDIAYEMLSKRKRAVPFQKIWEEVCKKMNFDEEKAKKKIASFYSDLMLDTRFTSMTDNKWDLSARHTFDENHVDTTGIELEDDDEEVVTYADEELEIVSEYSDENTGDEGY